MARRAHFVVSLVSVLIAQLILSCKDADSDVGEVSAGRSSKPPPSDDKGGKDRDEDAGRSDTAKQAPSAAGSKNQGGSGGAGAAAAPHADAGVSAAQNEDAGPAGRAADTQSGLPGNVEAVMLQTVQKFGVGGNLSIDYHPVVLFKDGTACRDVNFLVQDLSAEQHRNMFPDRWTHWQTIDGKVALESGQDKWTKLSTQLRYPPMPQGATLQGVFKHLTGGGDVAFGGDTVIAVETTFGFNRDHRFARGASSALISSNAAVGSSPPDQLGSYAFDGYHATLTYDSGEVVATSVVWTEQDARLVFLGGRSYVMGD